MWFGLFFLSSSCNIGLIVKWRNYDATFGFSTMPAMLGLGFVVGFLKGSGFREVMIKIASLIIIAYGLYMSYLGYSAAIG